MKTKMYRRNVFMILVIKVLAAFLALIMLGVMGDIVSRMFNMNNTLIAGLVEVVMFIYFTMKFVSKNYKKAIYR